MASKTTPKRAEAKKDEGNKLKEESLKDKLIAPEADKNTINQPKLSEATSPTVEESGENTRNCRGREIHADPGRVYSPIKDKPPNIENDSNPQSSNDTNTNEPDEQNQGVNQNTPQPELPAGFKIICNSVVILLVLAFIALVAAILLAPSEPEMKTDFHVPKIFENKLVELQSSFTNQTDRFWRIVKNRGLAHLRNADPPQPLVLLLAAPPAAHGVVDCLARKLAEVLDPRNKRTLATIDGTKEKRFAGEKAKKKMDEPLINKFKAGHRAALIHHLELLPFPSPLLFYSYCHDKNAPYKHVAIIFTVHLPAEPDASLSPSEAEGTVEKYLSSEVWAREDQDAVAALLSYVADTVALMNGEPDSVKASC